MMDLVDILKQLLAEFRFEKCRETVAKKIKARLDSCGIPTEMVTFDPDGSVVVMTMDGEKVRVQDDGETSLCPES